MACRSNSMYPAALDVTRSLGGGKIEKLFRDCVLTDKDSALQTCTKREGRLSFWQEFQSGGTEGDDERWEENKQHGATCCVKPEPQDYDWKSASVETTWGGVVDPLASSRLHH